MTIYKDQLEAVYKLIERPEAWTQGRYAYGEGNSDLDEFNSSRAAKHANAVCWCLAGAAVRCNLIESDSDTGNSAALQEALGLEEDVLVCDWNDSHTHPEVLALLQAAIDRAPTRLLNATVAGE